MNKKYQLINGGRTNRYVLSNGTTTNCKYQSMFDSAINNPGMKIGMVVNKDFDIREAISKVQELRRFMRGMSYSINGNKITIELNNKLLLELTVLRQQ